MRHDVFVSYHRNSSARLVESIVDALERQGIRCWYAPRDVESKYAGDIVRAIEECKVFLLILNEQSTHSEHVLNEINYAFNCFNEKHSVRLLPFKTDKKEVSDDVKYYLGRIHFLDASEPPEVERINALVSRIDYWLKKDNWETESFSCAQREKMADYSRNSSLDIRSVSLVHNTNFVGRKKELEMIYHLLHSENNKLFLFGPGGIGKSEIAKQYAIQYRSEYKTILWFTYNTSIMDMIISDQFLCIRGLENDTQNLSTIQSREVYYYKKLNFLKDHCGSETLIILDNIDQEDERLNEFLEGDYSVILSSRLSREKEGYQELTIDSLGTDTEQILLFEKFYKRPLKVEEESVLLELFREIGCHTYGIELLAKQMQASRMTPSVMLDFLKDKQIVQNKRSQLVMDSILNVMDTLFHLSDLNEEKLSILKNMALLPTEGIETEQFFELTELEDFMLIDELIDNSLIQYNYITDIISLHPLIHNVICRNYPAFVRECSTYIQNITKQLTVFTHKKSEDKKKLLSLAEHYYVKWCDPGFSYNISFMEQLGETYAEYFMRDKSIAIFQRLIHLSEDPLKKSWYHYYIANQRRCLEQYEELSKEADMSLSELSKIPDSIEKQHQLSLAFSMNGWAKFHENNMDASAHYFEQSLKIRKELLPDDHVLIAWGYYNSANSFAKANQTKQAIVNYQEAISRFLRIGEVGICVPAYIGLAEAYINDEMYQLAEEALNQAFAFEYEYYGEENCRKYWLYDVKAKLLSKQGFIEEAAEYAQQSKEEYEKYLANNEGHIVKN